MRTPSIPALLLCTLAVGCGASLPPAELVLARESYANTAKGPAKDYRPVEGKALE